MISEPALIWLNKLKAAKSSGKQVPAMNNVTILESKCLGCPRTIWIRELNASEYALYLIFLSLSLVFAFARVSPSGQPSRWRLRIRGVHHADCHKFAIQRQLHPDLMDWFRSLLFQGLSVSQCLVLYDQFLGGHGNVEVDLDCQTGLFTI